MKTIKIYNQDKEQVAVGKVLKGGITPKQFIDVSFIKHHKRKDDYHKHLSTHFYLQYDEAPLHKKELISVTYSKVITATFF